MKNYNINIFDLDVYIENNRQIKKLIQEKLKEKKLSVKKLAKNINLSNSTIYPFLDGSSMRSQNLKKILDFLDIKEKDIQNQRLIIYSSPYKHWKYNLKFPLELTPLHIRTTSHILGDGVLEKCSSRWYQKSDIGGMYMINLINLLAGIKIKQGAKYSYGIPMLIIDIVCSALNLLRKDLKTSDFVKKVILLPREFRIQLLAALVVDEGHISKSSIKITNTNLNLIKTLRDLILSLGYTCSKVICHSDKVGEIRMICGKQSVVNYKLYDLYLHADGLLKFKEDLDIMINKYKDVAGLWQKQNDLLHFSSIVDLEKLRKRRISQKKLIPIIKKEILNHLIFVKEFAQKYNLDYIRAYKLFFRLKKRGEIQKISTGVFASNDYKGPKNLTLRSKIEEILLSRKYISVKQISKIIKGNPKSIATQLSKLCKIGQIKRKKRGIYFIN